MDGGFRETGTKLYPLPNRAWFTEGEDKHLKTNKQIKQKIKIQVTSFK